MEGVASREGYGERVPERLFTFIQAELPFELGPPDGRWLVRSPLGEVEHVVVLVTLGARTRARRLRRARHVAPEPEPAAVPLTRATVIDAVPLSAARQAHAWLKEVDPDRATAGAFAVLNRMLFAHRIATADAYMRELSPTHALLIRAGFGEGERVADGRWVDARELSMRGTPRVRRRVAALRPDEHLAALLGAREEPLLCEELALRARLDIDQGRVRLAATELHHAYEAALAELGGERGGEHGTGLGPRLDELRAQLASVRAAARAAAPDNSGHRGGEVDARAVRHALERLEAALRARRAAGPPRGVT